jgi:hypothetical protein
MLHLFFITIVIGCFQLLDAQHVEQNGHQENGRSELSSDSVTSNLPAPSASVAIPARTSSSSRIEVYLDSPCGNWSPNATSYLSRSSSQESLKR